MTKWQLEAIVELWRGRAAVWRSRDYDEAKIYFGKGWEKRPVLELHRLVVHELLHLVLRDVEFIEDLLDGQLHRDVDRVIHKAHAHNVEQAVDRLAYRLVELVGVKA